MKKLILLMMLSVIIGTQDASAFKIVFHGSGGITLSSGGGIESICPQNGKSVCAEVECEGVLAWIKCIGLWILHEGIAPAGASGVQGQITEYSNGSVVNIRPVIIYHKEAKDIQ